jgi:hypothetical protein
MTGSRAARADRAGSISRRFDWKDAAAAHREVEQGHPRGKLVLIVDADLAADLGV